VTRFEVRTDFLDRYEVHQVGGQTILEYWIPAEDLDEFNANIVGTIEGGCRVPVGPADRSGTRRAARTAAVEHGRVPVSSVPQGRA
jgi:hypothetical protein